MVVTPMLLALWLCVRDSDWSDVLLVFWLTSTYAHLYEPLQSPAPRRGINLSSFFPLGIPALSQLMIFHTYISVPQERRGEKLHSSLKDR